MEFGGSWIQCIKKKLLEERKVDDQFSNEITLTTSKYKSQFRLLFFVLSYHENINLHRDPHFIIRY